MFQIGFYTHRSGPRYEPRKDSGTNTALVSGKKKNVIDVITPVEVVKSTTDQRSTTIVAVQLEMHESRSHGTSELTSKRVEIMPYVAHREPYRSSVARRCVRTLV